MDVKIIKTEQNTIIYEITILDDSSKKFLLEKLEENTKEEENKLIYTIKFKPELYPFQSPDAQLKYEDYIAREEIEMKYFLLSFLEDM